jgi:hypothetical protein
MLPLGRAGLTPASRRVTVGEGETADAGVFLFEPAGIIGGRVLDAEGVAAAGIYVEALTLAYEFPGLRRWKRVGFGNSATTDAEGRFRLPWLPEGEFYLRAVDQGTQDAQLVTYFPGTAEASAATAVLVYAGRESVAEFRMTEAGSHRLEGQLFADLPGVSGLPGASLYLIPRADGSPLVEDPRAFLRSELQPGSDGRFSVGGLSSGRYDLIALAEDESGLETGITARTLVEIGDASLADVPLILRAGETVEGSLRAAGAEGAVELVPSRGGVGGIPRGESRTRVRVELVPSEDSPTGEIRPDLLSDTDFRFSDVPRGRYRVRARLMGAGAGERAYIADILANGRSVLGDDLVVAGEGVELAVIVGNDGSALRVRFRDAAGDPVQIAVVPDSLPAADRTPTSSRLVFDPDRGTRIANLGPGRYRLYAWHNPLREPALFPVSDPQFLRQYQSQSVSVVLGANSELDVEVPLARLIE